MTAVIPILNPAAAQGGCGACVHSAAGPVCHTAAEVPCGGPALSGPPEQLERVLHVLEQALGVGSPQPEAPSLPARSLVHSLRLGDGEAELTLAVARRCGGALLADTAFQALRQLLPDTDIYVLHAA